MIAMDFLWTFVYSSCESVRKRSLRWTKIKLVAVSSPAGAVKDARTSEAVISPVKTGGGKLHPFYYDTS